MAVGATEMKAVSGEEFQLYAIFQSVLKPLHWWLAFYQPLAW